MNINDILAAIVAPRQDPEATRFYEADALAAQQAIAHSSPSESVLRLLVAAMLLHRAAIKPERLSREPETFNNLLLEARVNYLNGLHSIYHSPESKLADGTTISDMGLTKIGAIFRANGSPVPPLDHDTLMADAASLETQVDALAIKLDQEEACVNASTEVAH